MIDGWRILTQRDGGDYPLVACRLTLLGGFALESGDGKALTMPTRKDELLLAYLALSAGKPQTRERLAGLLWGGRAETQARDSLKQALARVNAGGSAARNSPCGPPAKSQYPAGIRPPPSSRDRLQRRRCRAGRFRHPAGRRPAKHA
jgi:hypothetical protein